MNETEVVDYIKGAFDGVDIVETSGDSFFFYDPRDGQPVDHMFPFATFVTSNHNDTASDLDREGMFRLNVGVRKETYQAMFGNPPAFRTDGGFADTGFDYTTADTVMPHPVYAAMFWVCIVNPGASTFETVKPLLAEAYEMAAVKHAKGGHA